MASVPLTLLCPPVHMIDPMCDILHIYTITAIAVGCSICYTSVDQAHEVLCYMYLKVITAS